MAFNWELLIRAATELTDAGCTAFTRRMLIQRVLEVEPLANPDALGATIQGMADNLTGGNRSRLNHIVFHSVKRGEFVLMDADAWKSTTHTPSHIPRHRTRPYSSTRDTPQSASSSGAHAKSPSSPRAQPRT